MFSPCRPPCQGSAARKPIPAAQHPRLSCLCSEGPWASQAAGTVLSLRLPRERQTFGEENLVFLASRPLMEKPLGLSHSALHPLWFCLRPPRIKRSAFDPETPKAPRDAPPKPGQRRASTSLKSSFQTGRISISMALGPQMELLEGGRGSRLSPCCSSQGGQGRGTPPSQPRWGEEGLTPRRTPPSPKSKPRSGQGRFLLPPLWTDKLF